MASLAVLTGDIVNSEDIDPAHLDQAIAILEQCCTQISEWDDINHIRFSRVSGDGWQVALRPGKFALRAAVLLRAQLLAQNIAQDTRVSIAIGDGPDTLPKDLNSASGAAFTQSGRALSRMAKRMRMTSEGDKRVQATVLLIDFLMTQWTRNQANVMSHALHHPAQPQGDIARQLGKTPQAINKTLHAAGFLAVEAALKLIEQSHDAS